MVTNAGFAGLRSQSRFFCVTKKRNHTRRVVRPRKGCGASQIAGRGGKQFAAKVNTTILLINVYPPWLSTFLRSAEM